MESNRWRGAGNGHSMPIMKLHEQAVTSEDAQVSGVPVTTTIKTSGASGSSNACNGTAALADKIEAPISLQFFGGTGNEAGIAEGRPCLASGCVGSWTCVEGECELVGGVSQPVELALGSKSSTATTVVRGVGSA